MGEPMTESHDSSPQQRFEETRLGRGVISLFLTITVLSIVIWNMPDSYLRATVQPIVTPYVALVGLDQSWRIFAPDPRQTSLFIHARIEYDDGSESRWDMPAGDVIGPYRSYRWRKWADQVRQDARSAMWEPTARYLASLHTADGRTPTRVTLVRTWADVPALGSGDAAEWHEFEYFIYELEPSS
jgi:hypothetical protein